MIVVFGQPIPKGRPRVTKGGHAFTPARTRKAEAAVRRALEGHAPFAAQVPLLLMTVHYVPIPKSWSKKKRNARGWPLSRPDLDNYMKLTADAANELLYADDAQVVAQIGVKTYDEEPRTEIYVREFDTATFEQLLAIAKHQEEW